MKATLETTEGQEKVGRGTRMGTSTKETSRMGRHMARVSTHGLMERFMMVSGRMD